MHLVQRVSRRISLDTVAGPAIWLELVNGVLQNVTLNTPGKINKFPFSSAFVNEYETQDKKVGRATTLETIGTRVRVNIKGYVPGMVAGDELVVCVEAGKLGKLIKATQAAPGTYEIVARCETIDDVNQLLTWTLASPKFIVV